ncbi:MAG TPA: hypothetical protein PKL04_08195 [Methanofastidiosum sp.]|nr:hypothetical protein [Methanofastidiosum sp.]
MIKVTLDTCCLINYQNKKDTEVSQIIDMHKKNAIDIKCTTRVDFDQRNYGDQKKREELDKLCNEFGTIGTVFRWGFSRLDSGDVFTGKEEDLLEEKLKAIMFPNVNFGILDERNEGRLADIDHLIGHILEKRDYFVTSNTKDFIDNRKRENLKSEFDLNILTPKEFIESVSI